MKKLFTLLAFLAVFMGANAVEITDFSVDYTEKGSSTIGWKADLIQDDWITADAEGLHLFNPEVTENFYDYQLWIFSGANLEAEMNYTVKIVAKVSSGSADVRCRVGDWNGGIQGTITVNSTDYQEYTISGAATVASNGLLVQFGDYVGTVSFKSVTITHEGKTERPVEWVEMITNGNAETPWGELADVAYNDETSNYKICAWSKEKGHNVDTEAENQPWNPFPANIEVDPTDPNNHVFVCHGQPATTEGDASAWDNQFWIQAPRMLKEGEEFKVHFRYRASAPVSSTDTQIHYQTPSNYLIWHAIGNIAFDTEWKEFDDKMTIQADMAGGWSIAFNLNSVVKDAVDFYFDDISIQEMKLDHGLFVAASNNKTGVEYDYDAAIEFVEGEDPDGGACLVATVGTEGNKDSWVNELQISTVRGNDKAFRSGTIKPVGTITGNDTENWQDYTAGSNAKIALPAAGVWKIYLAPSEADPSVGQVLFMEVEGDDPVIKEPEDPVTNKTAIVVKGKTRDDLKDDKNQEGVITVREEADDPAGENVGGEGHEGQTWDNQFFFKANRALVKDEVTVLKFKYKSSVDAKTTTQCHGETPGAYMHWAAIGDVNFTTEWQDFEKEFTVPAEADGMWNIAFNMAEIKEACDYEITDVQWYLKSDVEGKTLENLINAEGTSNFFVKEGAGTDPHEFVAGESGIINVKKDAVKADGAIYNLAGQRVSKDYKGIVVKNGKKYITK